MVAMETALTEAVRRVANFATANPGVAIKTIEARLKGCLSHRVVQDPSVLAAAQVFASADVIKGVVSQINNIVHAAGILGALPKILEPDEVLEYVSLAAGTGTRRFDIATDRRLAEFKFYLWRKSNSARLRQGLVAFIQMAESDDPRTIRELYFLGTEPFVHFMTGKTQLSTMLKKHHPGLLMQINQKNPAWRTVGDYFMSRRNTVAVRDVTPFLAISTTQL